MEYLYKNKYVCGLHFEKFMYKKRNLLSAAIPTLKLQKHLTDEIEIRTIEGGKKSSTTTSSYRLAQAPKKFTDHTRKKLVSATEILHEWDDTTPEEILQACDIYHIRA